MANKTLDDVVSSLKESSSKHNETNTKLDEISATLTEISAQVKCLHCHLDSNCDCAHEGD